MFGFLHLGNKILCTNFIAILTKRMQSPDVAFVSFSKDCCSTARGGLTLILRYELIFENQTVTVKCRSAIKAMYLYFTLYLQYSQRHTMINHCDRRITHLGDLNISFVLLNIFSKFLLHLECYLSTTRKAYRNK